MLHKHKVNVNMSHLMKPSDFVEGYNFVTTLLTSIYASMLACIMLLLLRMMYIAIRRRLKQPRAASNQV